jgi:two-component system, cell cycle sensor histidine kinase and response regulator CckA
MPVQQDDCIKKEAESERIENQLSDIDVQSKKLETIGSLAAGLAHDFNNILSHIRLSTQQLMYFHSPGTDERDILKELDEQVIRGAELTKQLLLFSKPCSDDAEYIDIEQYIKQIYKMFERIMAKHIRMHLSLDANNTEIKIKSSEFEQVLMNLVINARDAIGDSGDIEIGTSFFTYTGNSENSYGNMEKGEYVKIEVRDTGKGISSAALCKIFNPFYTSKKSGKGTGLGLSIIHQILKRRNGYIHIESQESIGTTVTLLFPYRKSNVQKIIKKQPGKKTILAGRERVLIIDDEELLMKSTARLFERYGYSTFTANDGQKGLSLFGAHKNEIDLILMDLDLPEIDGLKCTEQIRKIKPEVKVILLSAYFVNHQYLPDKLKNASVFIQKPYDSVQLLQTVRQLLSVG